MLYPQQKKFPPLLLLLTVAIILLLLPVPSWSFALRPLLSATQRVGTLTLQRKRSKCNHGNYHRPCRRLWRPCLSPQGSQVLGPDACQTRPFTLLVLLAAPRGNSRDDVKGGDGNSDSDKNTTKGKSENKSRGKGRVPGGGLFKNYKFGDITKSVITGITKKPDYEFGDLSRWVDSQIKSKVNEYTGKAAADDGGEYEFGDLSREILRRVSAGEYKVRDIATLCKALLSFGVGMSPVESVLPVTLLVNLLNYSIAQDVSSRLAGALALEIDRRMKEAITGDQDYELGDFTKRAVMRFVGKDGGEEYRFGDFTRAVMARFDGTDTASPSEKKNTGDATATTVDATTFGQADGGNSEEELVVHPLDPGLNDEGSSNTSAVARTTMESSSGGIDPRLLEELEQWDRSREEARRKATKKE